MVFLIHHCWLPLQLRHQKRRSSLELDNLGQTETKTTVRMILLREKVTAWDLVVEESSSVVWTKKLNGGVGDRNVFYLKGRVRKGGNLSLVLNRANQNRVGCWCESQGGWNAIEWLRPDWVKESKSKGKGSGQSKGYASETKHSINSPNQKTNRAKDWEGKGLCMAGSG